MRKLFILLGLSLLFTASSAAQQLFVAQKSRPLTTAPTSLLESEVAIDRDLLRTKTPKIVLSMPDGNRYEAIATEFEQRADGSTWRGQVPWRDLEMPASVTLTLHEDLVVGTISTPDGTYEIRPLAGNSHLLSKVDRSGQTTCGGAVAPPELATKEGGTPTVETIDPLDGLAEKNPTIDVLAIYSAGARGFVGGASRVRAQIQHDIDYANSAFRNSAVGARVRLRHVQELALPQNNWVNLDFLRSHPPIQALRDQVGADLVAAFVHNFDVCGRGYLMNPPNTGFAPWAYSITDIECGSHVLAHEIGHNLALHHDPDNAGSTPAFPWAYGHFVDLQFRTVMSYSNECTSRQCPTVPQFSHPGISYRGQPTGIANERHNARALGTTGAVAARFRAARSNLNAAFGISPNPPAVFDTVTFTDRSSGSPDSWSWTFGDGATSTDRNPTHVYTTPGSYDVRLTVTRDGQSDTEGTRVTVEDIVASFSVNPGSPRSGIPTYFLDTSTGTPSDYTWSFGDGTTSTEANPTHTYADSGTYTVELTVSRNGRSSTLTSDIVIADRECSATGANMCLNRSRFEVDVEWLDFEERTGIGTVAPQGSDDSGIFWFFDDSNLEMLVKVLDGCGINDHFWVFAAATTDVGYTLNITDTFSGEVRSYINPVGTSAPSITEIEAFETCNVQGAGAPLTAPTLAASAPVAKAPGACQPGEGQLCLNEGRFRAEVTWRDFESRTGPGSTVFNLEDSGMFWFFTPSNWEMLIKVLDGCDINGNFWVFATATTNVEYNLRVTDTETGDVRVYTNPLGQASKAITDTGAFASCSP